MLNYLFKLSLYANTQKSVEYRTGKYDSLLELNVVLNVSRSSPLNAQGLLLHLNSYLKSIDQECYMVSKV